MAEKWTEDEKIEMLLYSIKANKDCELVRKHFNLCRASLYGRTIDPGICKYQASKLIDCFEEIRITPPQCAQEFQAAIDCIKTSQSELIRLSTCNQEVENYENCNHPALERYKMFGDEFKTD